MKVALIDNGSLAPEAHRALRAIALEIGTRAGMPIEAVSWKHSDRIGGGHLDGTPVWTLGPWLRRHLAAGERDFIFVPYFISPQGAIGSALRAEIQAIAGEAGARITFSIGLAESGALAAIVADRVREAIRDHNLDRPALLVVDHGGPAAASAELRNRIAADLIGPLADEVGPIAAASMESPEGPAFAFNRPLFADALRSPGFSAGPVLVAPLFLAPGRHAGPGGDLERIAAEAAPGGRVRFAGLIGSHPETAPTLASCLRAAIAGGDLACPSGYLLLSALSPSPVSMPPFPLP